MTTFYDRYCRGFHQEVYNELLAGQEHIYEPTLQKEALLVTRETMRRIRYNVELLIPRLRELGYLFGEGLSQTDEERVYWEQEAPIYGAPTSETFQQVVMLEQLVGTLPMSLKCWYEEVGSVNLVGMFPSPVLDYHYGSKLDPLFTYTIKSVLQMIEGPVEDKTWEKEPFLPISPDNLHKYRYSGSGPYHIVLPCNAIDAFIINEPHHTTFVNYLRICLQWGGFPGLEADNRLTHDELEFLTKDLLRF